VQVDTRAENGFTPHRSQAGLTLQGEGGAANSCKNTHRKKILQMDTLKTVRAMRAVFCEVPPARRTPLPFSQIRRIN
jgi:hypothetical protein